MRPSLLAAVLAVAALPVHADQTTWRFSYTGFQATADTTYLGETTHTEGFLPDFSILGSFTGSDLDGDGAIALSELTSFDVMGREYISCLAAPSPYGRCSVSRFRYTLTGGLDFSAGWYGYDEYYSGWSGAVTTGREATESSYSYVSEDERHYYWTDATRFAIVPAPVPEPGAGAMAAAGLLLLAVGARRRA
nr:hypothetical protein [uncultured Massilia sp.]